MKFTNKLTAKRTIIGSVIFGMALWFYTSLNGNYTSYLTVPISVILPENRALEKPLPKTVSIEVKGTGWNIFNLMFLNNTKKIVVNLNNVKITDSIYKVGRSEILKGAQSFEKVELYQILPDVIDVNTGVVGSYSVPLISQVEINPKDGFSLIGNPTLNPSKIKIIGNDKFVKNIKNWTTKSEVFDEINKSINARVELSDSLSNMIKIEPTEVELIAEIQQTSEITFYELPISLNGGSLPKNHFLSPYFITITVRGGISLIDDIKESDVDVSIDFNQIINNNTGIIIPKVNLPENLEVIKMDPPFIYLTKRTKAEKLPI